MNIFELANKIIHSPLFIIYIIVIILIYKYNNKIVGIMGEYWVKQDLKKLDKDKYYILNNILIKSNNRTYQIDHIVISDYGIFVIENKHYHGIISGNEFNEKWCQSFGSRKYYFYNPIHQNYGHVMALKEILGLDIDKFIPIVTFSSKVVLRVEVKKNKVIYLDELLECIGEYSNVIIDNKDEICYKIKHYNIMNKKVRRKHIKYVKKVHYRK